MAAVTWCASRQLSRPPSGPTDDRGHELPVLWCGCLQEIEVATGVGLCHVRLVQRRPPPQMLRCRGPPGRPPPVELVRWHLEVQASATDVDPDQVAIADQGERSADSGFWGDVQE